MNWCRQRGFARKAAIAATFVLTLSGCPGGAELEHPDLYPCVTAPCPASAGSGNAGMGASAGSGGSAGSGAPFPSVDCGTLSAATILGTDCSKIVSCHSSSTKAASMLNLSPDSGFVARVKDVPAKHGNVWCNDIMDYCATPPTACPSDALLVNSSDWQKSWIVMKLRGTATGCGDPMPSAGYDATKEACLEKLVQAIAQP
jgi:hypothetical protein